MIPPSLSILLFAFCGGILGTARPLDTSIDSAFNIFAYGETISGLPIFYADGKAEIGDPALSKATVVQPVYFTVSGQPTPTWVAHPEITDKGTPEAAFTSKVLYLESFPSGTVGFVDAEEATEESGSTFHVYGNYVLIGGVEGANFYAAPTGAEGVYALVWSSEDEGGSDKIALTLRTTAPATDAVLDG